MSTDFLVEANVSGEEFFFYEVTCRVVSWLAEGETKTRAYDIVQQMHSFFEAAAGTGQNQTDTWAQIAPELGTSEERTQFINENFFAYAPMPFYPDVTTALLKIMPLAGDITSNNGMVAGVFTILTLLMFIAVGLRIYSRLTINGFLRAYDWVLLVATAITIGFGLMNTVTISTSTYQRLQCNRNWSNAVVEIQSSWATQILYAVGTFLVKASLLLFYWGLTTWWPLRIATIAIFVICLANNLGQIFVFVFQCDPVLALDGYAWYNQTCNTEMWLLSETITGSVNIATDVLIWMIPLPMIWKITRSWNERLMSCLTFGIGALACIACGFKFHVAHEQRGGYLIPPDQAKYLTWCIVEMSLAIICSCAPAIRALLIKKAPTFLGETVEYDDAKSEDKSSKDQEKQDSTSIVVTSQD